MIKTHLDKIAYSVIETTNNLLTDNKLIGFEWNIKYSDFVSNSHNAPKNGVTNFKCVSGKPTEYPGFYGKVWFLTENMYNPEIPFINFPLTDTHTGSGGFGYHQGTQWEDYVNFNLKNNNGRSNILFPYRYSYEYYFFLDDFPKLSKRIEEVKILNNLKGIIDNNHTHIFKWMDKDAPCKI